MRSSRIFSFKAAASAAVIAGSLLLFTGTASATIPVHDQQTAAQVTEVAQNTQTQIEYLRQIQVINRQILEAVGGQGASGLGSTFGEQAWSGFAGGGNFLGNIASQLMPIAGQLIGSLGGGGGPGGGAGAPAGTSSSNNSGTAVPAECQNVSWSDIQSSSECIGAALYTESGATERDRIVVQENRSNLIRESATRALAVAMASRDYTASMAERSSALEQMVGGANTLREDIKAGNGVLLALHQEIGSMQALLAAYVEMNAAAVLGSDSRITR